VGWGGGGGGGGFVGGVGGGGGFLGFVCVVFFLMFCSPPTQHTFADHPGCIHAGEPVASCTIARTVESTQPFFAKKGQRRHGRGNATCDTVGKLRESISEREVEGNKEAWTVPEVITRL